jgi:putative salt-induced outer membrane protein
MLLAALLPLADAGAEERGDVWSGEAEVGYVQTSGNTDTTSLNAKAGVGAAYGLWEHSLRLEAQFAEDSGTTTAERYAATAKSAYRITERGQLFARVKYLDDRFSGYDYQVSEAAGYRRNIIRTDEMRLDAEAGPGGRHSRTTEGDKEDELLLFLAGAFAWKFSESAEFGEELTVEAGEESTQTESVTWVKTHLAGRLSLKASYTVRHNSDPPPGTEDTDTLLALTLVYGLE